jgi:hypothetical protein
VASVAAVDAAHGADGGIALIGAFTRFESNINCNIKLIFLFFTLLL